MISLLTPILTFILIISASSSPLFDDETKCGYAACPEYNSDALNVHIVAHSHDDLGWLKTVEEYYVEDVLKIISTVVEALLENPSRRFVQVEVAFFEMWWNEQDETTKANVIDLVNNGRLEFIGGGWAMNDEGAAHYQSIIDQFTLGLRFLQETFGDCAKVKTGWQIDPFGHSREQASIFAQMGYDSFFLNRIDFRDRERRTGAKETDFLWKSSQSLDNSEIYTNNLYRHYSPPSGFCFDIYCNDPTINDDNQEERVKTFASYVDSQSQSYPTNNILITMGDDFEYSDALYTFSNLDLLIDGFNLYPQTTSQGQPIRVFYSTPTCYTKFVNDFVLNNGFNMTTKSDDFMPYADGPNTYWTGYFTSRPGSKRLERMSNNILQVAKQLSAIVKDGSYDDTISMKEALGIMQHHDAITGTEKAHVKDDYHLMLSNGIQDVSDFSSSVLSKLITESDNQDLNFASCPLSNSSECGPSMGDSFTVVVYNPLSRTVNTTVQLPVYFDYYNYWGPTGENGIPGSLRYPLRNFSNAVGVNYIAQFEATNIPPLGFNCYKIEREEAKHASSITKQIPTDTYSFTIDDTTGLLSTVTLNDITLEISQDFYYYDTYSSGAYMFTPLGLNRAREGNVNITDNNPVTQQFNEWITQSITSYPNYIEFDWVVGPLPVNALGKEVVIKYASYLKNEGNFYTDSNGRELLKRTRNSRPDYDYTNEQPVSGNYYPVNSKILIRDEEKNIEMAILTDRSQGGSSLNDGEIELLVHRACILDDGRGVGEVLNDFEYGEGVVIRGKHYLVVGKIGDVARIEKDIAQKNILAPWVFISNDGRVYDQAVNLQWSALQTDLPQNVQILTLEAWSEDVVLLRLEHIFEVGEDEELSQEVAIDLSDAFTTFTIIDLQEMTLGANEILEKSAKLRWSNDFTVRDDPEDDRDVSDLVVVMKPMQIRTFLAKVQYL